MGLTNLLVSPGFHLDPLPPPLGNLLNFYGESDERRNLFSRFWVPWLIRAASLPLGCSDNDIGPVSANLLLLWA